MRALYCIAEIRQAEASAAAQLPAGTLMERAGQAAANAAMRMLGAHAAPRVLILAGPGNNGGDALEVAARLANANIEVSVVHLAGATPSSFETARALTRAQASSAEFLALPAAPHISATSLAAYALVVDGLFGIGLRRPLDGDARALAEAVNAAGVPVLALDVPSGLDADTGALVGPQGIAIRANETITFIADKPGLHTCEGSQYAGQVHVADLGTTLPPAVALLNGPSLFAQWCLPRVRNAHKGSHGDALVLGGAHGMCGAAVLAARAALYAGAGRVFVACVDAGPAYDSTQPELMFRDASSIDMQHSAIVAGPGMGASEHAQHLLRKAIAAPGPLVLDADALNLCTRDPGLQAQVAAREGGAILTPHPLEAARLLGMTTAVVQADRPAAARELAARLHATVILKGAGTIIAEPDGSIVINPNGNPGLATAGTGDILAGLLGALLAQGWPRAAAAWGAVWLHGAAADTLVAQGIGPIGMTAGELPSAIRRELNLLSAPNGQRQS